MTTITPCDGCECSVPFIPNQSVPTYIFELSWTLADGTGSYIPSYTFPAQGIVVPYEVKVFGVPVVESSIGILIPEIVVIPFNIYVGTPIPNTNPTRNTNYQWDNSLAYNKMPFTVTAYKNSLWTANSPREPYLVTQLNLSSFSLELQLYSPMSLSTLNNISYPPGSYINETFPINVTNNVTQTPTENETYSSDVAMEQLTTSSISVPINNLYTFTYEGFPLASVNAVATATGIISVNWTFCDKDNNTVSQGSAQTDTGDINDLTPSKLTQLTNIATQQISAYIQNRESNEKHYLYLNALVSITVNVNLTVDAFYGDSYEAYNFSIPFSDIPIYSDIINLNSINIIR